MKLPTELVFLLLTHFASSTPLRRRGASFSSLTGLTTLDHDFSRPEPATRPDKFFHESIFNTHYDGRFAKTELPPDVRTFHLRLLLKTYMETMERIGLRTWIVHGCLLGWYWNGKIMPWDNDVDVMLDERSIAELGNWYNMTVHHFTGTELGLVDDDNTSNSPSPDTKPIEADDDKLSKRNLEEEIGKTGKKYLLEVNPHYTNKSTQDVQNVIDARWIDTATGLYIDITTIHTAPAGSSFVSAASAPPDTAPDRLYTKDQHGFLASQLFPLRSTTFEGIAVSIPYAYEELLLEEYGAEALTETWFKGYGFDEGRKEWVPAEPTGQQVVRGEARKGARKGESARGRGRGKMVEVVE